MPRVVVAGLSGESGKTLVSLALSLEAVSRGIPVQAFKKGPDYIDAAWLAWASRRPARNLDSFLMGLERASASFCRNAASAGLNVIEGNRGLYDGLDARGSQSTAELAKALRAPVLLVVNATKVTRTAAALVLGCQTLDPDVRIAGVILNQVAGKRHERILRDSIESACGIPVLGAIPRAASGTVLTSRHLGLVTPHEDPHRDLLARDLLDLVAGRLEIERVLEIARQAPAFAVQPAPLENPEGGDGLTIGYLNDSAFSFYYPENLEALRAAGARLVALSALTSDSLPDCLDALYIGGGFPETHARELAGNPGFLDSIRRAAAGGLPIYAECGGLMLLSRALRWHGSRHPMAGVLPFEVEVFDAPQGHGYTELSVDTANPFFPAGTRLKGHEFHYSGILPDGELPRTACAVLRGTGCYAGRDAVVVGNVWASYTHLHALATPEWGCGMIGAAERHRHSCLCGS